MDDAAGRRGEELRAECADALVALDFPGVSSGLAQKTQTIGVGMSRSVTTVEAAGRTRVVINLVAPVGYEVTSQGNQNVKRIAGKF